MNGVPAYSQAALAARDVFSVGFERVFFYVEDMDQENLYEIIFKRCFPRLESFKVFPLGGKKAVLSRAESDVEQLSASIKIYVLDKDFDDLLGVESMIQNVVYLDDYCVENALIDELSVVQLAIDEKPKMSKVKISQKVDFDAVMQSWLPLLDRLHRAFFLAQKHGLDIKNCDAAPEEFTVNGNPSLLDPDKIEQYVLKVSSLLVEKGVLTTVGEYQKASRLAFGSARMSWCNINGKFLLKLVYHRLRTCNLISNIRIETMTVRLARYSRLIRLRSFKRKVNVIVAA